MIRKYKAIITVTSMFLLSASVSLSFAQNYSNSLEQNFRDPPDSAKPRTWWHWTGGNITKAGITKDLEWMKRIGIAGMQLADVSFGGGQNVANKIEFASPEWLDAVRHAASEADRLGLEMAIFSSAGWSLTGGPWVKPEQAMKKLVWSQTVVEGPQSFSGVLAQPPSNNGPIRNLQRGGRDAQSDPIYYGDSKVIAFRTPMAHINMAKLNPKVTVNGNAIDAAAPLDDDLNSALIIPAPESGGSAQVLFEFKEPFTARAITIAGRRGIPVGRVSASDNGTDFRTLVTLPGAQLYRQGRVRTFAFAETTAKFFRIELTGAPLGPAETMSQEPAKPVREYELTEAILHSDPRVHRWEEKAGFSFLFEYESVPTPSIPSTAAIRRSEIIDLTSKMDRNGRLRWDVPPGRWTILRMGYSLTGAKNRPATPAGLGYEVDKLSAEYIESYYHGYFDPIANTLGPLFGKSLRYVLMDSWEAGMQNWTDEIISEFQKRRGYDPTGYLPVLTGRVVESAEVSDCFLWDFRRTLADLYADYHYGALTDLLAKRGVGTYAEAAGVSLEVPEDTLLNKSKVTIPMGEFWVRALHPELMYYQDVRGAASASHIYGKTLVAAEAFTGGSYEAPYTLKKVSDYWFAQGVNRLVFHTSAHQPLDTRPGNTMVGTHINRNITWAEQAGPFMTYLARISYLLQQGRFVADIAYLLNDGAPSTMPIWGEGLTPRPPDGYDYDYVNADVLINRMSVRADGRLALPNGMTYRILVLPQIDRMTVPVLRKICKLVKDGATVVGPRPNKSPSLTEYPEANNEIRARAQDLWGDLDGISRTKRAFGKGRVVWGLPLEDVLDSLDVPKDVEYSRPLDAEIAWIHRRTDNADIYFIANLTDRPHAIDVRFRISDKEAELWHPDTGEIEPAQYSITSDRTTVSLDLDQRESVFVVFRKMASAPSHSLSTTKSETLVNIDGPWDVNFPPNLGAPEKIELPKLQSWTENENDGIKYFSGTATYTRTIQAEQSWFQDQTKLFLDLGLVRDIAEIAVNGKRLGIVWKPPYRMDVTGALKPGENKIQIEVTNQWMNRLIGDQSAPEDKKVLSPVGFMVFFGGTPPLSESGLIGPVSIVSVVNQ
ncbi:MAG: hypothetical protein JXM79_12125 [Sedimentisphaerales bacterium]|nr:hypothetical protein [Sedimentisphaerales bacterium]